MLRSYSLGSVNVRFYGARAREKDKFSSESFSDFTYLIVTMMVSVRMLVNLLFRNRFLRESN